MSNFPRVSFGMIVLNGEPFLKYNLRAIYPFAYEIIVAEGASVKAREIARDDGHSRDRTLEELHRFKAMEDPEQKLRIVTAEDEGHPDGFWPGDKDEQSRAYAKRATGDWLWQVDVDEFYQPHDVDRLFRDVLSSPDVFAVSFQQIPFWGGVDWIVDGWYLRQLGAGEFHRLFRWGKGFDYAKHRPPTVLSPSGVDVRKLGWKRGGELARQGIFLYHYSLLFPRQVSDKAAYYSTMGWGTDRAREWAETCFERLGRPFHVHNVYAYPSWLEAAHVRPPPQVQAMWSDLTAINGRHAVPVRVEDDIRRLLASPWYRAIRFLLKNTPAWFVRVADWSWRRVSRLRSLLVCRGDR